MEDEGQELITVDHWIKFQAPRRIAELVKVRDVGAPVNLQCHVRTTPSSLRLGTLVVTPFAILLLLLILANKL